MSHINPENIDDEHIDDEHIDHQHKEERLRRWRLILGGAVSPLLGDPSSEGIKMSNMLSKRSPSFPQLSPKDQEMNEALNALYGSGREGGERGEGGEGGERGGAERRGGLGNSAPQVTRWLGDIRRYFPQSVVQVMQRDALERLELQTLLSQPTLLNELKPDVHLIAQIVSLSKVISDETKASARSLVQQVVEQIMRRLSEKTRQTVTGSLNRSARHNRPKHHEIDWSRTIRANLKHYQPKYQTIIPERQIGFARKKSRLKDLIICLDQSGSMASSLVYGAVFSAVLSSLRALSTRVIAFDTSVVDLTHLVEDPVELLFGVQLGGGTDIHRVLRYCQSLVIRPQDTTLVLISDLYEGGDEKAMLQRAEELIQSGVQLIALLALNDEGRPSYSRSTSAQLAQLGAPAFACTPDQFPDLIAAALQRQSLSRWAERNEVLFTHPLPPHKG